MATPRNSIIRGPAIVQMGGQSFYTKDDISVNLSVETFVIPCSIGGEVDERILDVMNEITFTPVGAWTTAQLAILFPYTNPIIGASIYGDTDVPVTIWPLNGKEKIVYTAGAIVKMPSIILSASKTPLGSMTIRCIGKNNAAWSAADKRFAITATAAFEDSTFAVSAIPTIPYTLVLAGGAAPWNAIKTQDGITVDFSLTTEPVPVDDEGKVDESIKGLKISAKFIPVGITLTQLMAKFSVQDTGFARGISLNSRAANMTISGPAAGNPLVVLNSMALKTTAQSYSDSASKLRIGEIEFISTRPNGTGAMFSVGVVAGT